MGLSIYGMIYDELDAKRKHAPKEFKKYARAFDALDREAWADIILDGDIFWIEYYQYNYGAAVTNRENAELKDFCEELGYKYLYDVV